MKTRLQDITRSIQEIAEEMNFPNPSFFAQYFRKYTGLTPKGYRETIHHHGG
ncbi:MAG: helix-turn-helix domain-containing protein [Bacteroidales bacterium]